MLAFLNSKLGIYVICGLIGATFIGWTYYEVYQSGRAYERSAQPFRDHSPRKETDAAVSAMDDAGLCAALGGRNADTRREIIAKDRPFAEQVASHNQFGAKRGCWK